MYTMTILLKTCIFFTVPPPTQTYSDEKPASTKPTSTKSDGDDNLDDSIPPLPPPMPPLQVYTCTCTLGM